MFEGFSQQIIKTSGAAINVVHGGDGPPLLLLHGYPQTHVMWHKTAPRLADRFTVVCPDLRGYGDSDKPESDTDHFNYSKRAIAQDQVEVMEAFGFDRFAVVGHDRGARVAHRMSLDHPDKISQVALLDIVPTAYAFANVNKQMAIDTYHWFFLIQPDGLPETLISSDADFYLRWTFDHWGATPGAITEEAFSEYRRCFNTATIRASCEDYRAAATVDLQHDEYDKSRKLEMPLLLLWSSTGTGATYDVLSIWRDYARDVRGRALDCGHFLAEERPTETAAALIEFLSYRT
jgi:haloacetate dehalogenase